MVSELDLSNIESVIALRVNIFREVGKIRSDEEAKNMLEINRKFFLEQYKQGNLSGFMDSNENKIISIALGLKQIFPPINIQDQGKWAYIFNVYTTKEYRRKGNATLLVRKLIENFKHESVEKILLDANTDSVALYEKFGFVLKDHHMVLDLIVDIS